MMQRLRLFVRLPATKQTSLYKNMFATLGRLGGINCTSKRELLASYRP
jgi:hypothetical protein